MDERIMERLATECGFSAAAVIGTDEFCIVPGYRKFCEQNMCGSYNKNYGCPPYCGSPQEMEEKALGFARALVLQTRSAMKDLYDPAEAKELKKIHTQKTLKLIRRLKDEGMDEKILPVMAGPCNFCEVCKMPDGLPCPHEEYRFSCLSAYCIDAGSLAKSCGMDMSWTGNVVSFFSICLFGKKEKKCP